MIKQRHGGHRLFLLLPRLHPVHDWRLQERHAQVRELRGAVGVMASEWLDGGVGASLDAFFRRQVRCC